MPGFTEEGRREVQDGPWGLGDKRSLDQFIDFTGVRAFARSSVRNDYIKPNVFLKVCWLVVVYGVAMYVVSNRAEGIVQWGKQRCIRLYLSNKDAVHVYGIQERQCRVGLPTKPDSRVVASQKIGS